MTRETRKTAEPDALQQAIALVKANRKLEEERKRAEQEIRDLAKIIFENPNPIFRIGKKGVLLYANPPALSLLNHGGAKKGYPVSSKLQEMVNQTLTLQTIQEFEIKVNQKIYFLEFVPILNEGYVNVYGRDITKRKKAEAQNQMQFKLTRIFSNAKSLDEAIPQILQTIGEFMQWDISLFWQAPEKADRLECLCVRNVSNLDENESFKQFQQISLKSRFKKKDGLPGRVWALKKACWIPDVIQDSNFPRAPFAEKLGMKSGFGFPVIFDSQCMGVIEIFTRQLSDPDATLINIIDNLSHQIGQSIKLKKIEDSLNRLKFAETN